MLRFAVPPLGADVLGDGLHDDWRAASPGKGKVSPGKRHRVRANDVMLPMEALLPGLSPRTPAGSPPTPAGYPGTPARTPTRTPEGLPPRTPSRSSVRTPGGGLSAPRTPAASSTASGGQNVACGDAAAEAGVAAGVEGAREVADLRQYGLTLGVDIEWAEELRWVVQEAFTAPLPKGWAEHKDDDGRVYFWHDESEESVWEHPMDAIYRDLLGLVSRVRQDAPAGAADAEQRRVRAIEQHVQGVHKRAVDSLENWSGPYASEYGEYYYNAALNVSSWHCPLEDWERELATSERILSGCLLSELRPRARKVKLRTVAWTILVLRHFVYQRSPRRSYVLDEAVDEGVIRQIDCDIPRTAGGDPELAGSLGVARALLLRHAAEDPELGYCQGMNLVAAVFAVAAPSQDEAYGRFHAFTRELRGLWTEGFPLLMQGMAQFEALAQARPWFQHLCQHHVQPDMYLPRAWMGLFTKWLPLPTRVLFLSQLEGTGLSGLLAVSLAILDLHLPWLLQQGNMDDLLASMEKLRQFAPDAAALLAATQAWLPVAAAVAPRPARSVQCRKPLLRRQGYRVLDSRGREALYVGVSKRLSTLWTERRPSTTMGRSLSA